MAPKYRLRKRRIDRLPDEWTIPELAEQIGMPEATLYTWVQQGRLRSRVVQPYAGRAKLVYANAEIIGALKTIRTTPAPWHHPPPQLNITQPTDES
jgi:transposase-like protein